MSRPTTARLYTPSHLDLRTRCNFPEHRQRVTVCGFIGCGHVATQSSTTCVCVRGRKNPANCHARQLCESRAQQATADWRRRRSAPQSSRVRWRTIDILYVPHACCLSEHFPPPCVFLQYVSPLRSTRRGPQACFDRRRPTRLDGAVAGGGGEVALGWLGRLTLAALIDEGAEECELKNLPHRDQHDDTQGEGRSGNAVARMRGEGLCSSAQASDFWGGAGGGGVRTRPAATQMPM